MTNVLTRWLKPPNHESKSTQSQASPTPRSGEKHSLTTSPTPPALKRVCRARPSRFPILQSNDWTFAPDLFTPKQCHEWYPKLVELVQDYVATHGQPTIMMYNKPTMERRQAAYFSKVDTVYRYSGSVRPIGKWNPLLDVFMEMASKLTGGAVFDSCLCNWYRDGTDHISKHRDQEALDTYVVSFSIYPSDTERVRDFLIYAMPHTKTPSASASASTSVSASASASSSSASSVATTDATIKTKQTDTLLTSIPLTNGCAIVMNPGMQTRYKHALPPRPQIRTGRINLTLRQHARGGVTSSIGSTTPSSTTIGSTTPSSTTHSQPVLTPQSSAT